MSTQQPIITEKKVRKTKKQIAEIVEPTPLESIPEEQEIKPKRRVKKVVKAESMSVPTPSVNPPTTPAPKAPRKQSTWFQALKKWNEGRERYSIPKKDTPEYAEIQKLMGGLSI